MSFDWKEFLKLAEWLGAHQVRHCAREACLRTAISRYYYSVFCCSRNFALANEGLKIKKGKSVHRQVIDHYKKGDLDHKTVGTNLRRLLDNRGDADYEDTVQRPDKLTRDSFLGATLIFGILPKFERSTP